MSHSLSNNSEDRFLRLADVQRMLGVSRTTVWRWQAERGLKVVTIGGVTRIRESDLQAFLKRHEADGAGVDLLQAPAAGQTARAL